VKQEDIVKKLRALKMDYITQNIAKNPAALPEHLGEFLGYATFLYEFYADKLESYEKLEAKVVKEEYAAFESHNANVESRSERMSVAEMQSRIDVRLAEEKGKKKRLEQLVKGNTLHINGCQSLMKNWGDEAKGVR
jgi:hypothetical protein